MFNPKEGFVVKDFETLYKEKADKRKAKFGKEIDTTPGSNYSLVDTIHTQSQVDLQNQMQQTIQNIFAYFDEEENRIASSKIGTFEGVYEALTKLSHVYDFTAFRDVNDFINIILLLKKEAFTNSTINKETLLKIGQTLHETLPIGIPLKGDKEVTVLAVNKQEVKYTFSLGKTFKVFLKINYFKSHNEEFGLDTDTKLKELFTHLVNSKYNKLGQNIEYQDFHLLTTIKGIAQIEVKYALVEHAFDSDVEDEKKPKEADYKPLDKIIELSPNIAYFFDVENVIFSLVG